MKKYLFILGFMCLVVLTPDLALAQTPANCADTSAVTQTSLCNPTQSFAKNLPAFLFNVLKFFGMAIGLQAIIYVVYSGFRMVISQGNSEEVATAKASFQWALLGMLLVMGSFAIVYAVAQFIGATNVDDGNLLNPFNPTRDEVINPTQSNSFMDLLMTILRGFMGISALIAMLMIMINGFRYITSGGNDEKAESAKSGLQWAVVGLVVMIMAYVIVLATEKLIRS